jgi:hypothetical protein
MSYVGWKDVKSAVRYVDAISPFGALARPQRLPQQPGAVIGLK